MSDLNAPFGIIGIHNLGGTSWLNACLQSLFQISPLTNYFVSKKYAQHINKTYKLGWNGVVAEAYAKLIQSIFTKSLATNTKVVKDIKLFEKTLSPIVPRFSIIKV